ncbi:MAG: hypothetical protein LC102_06065 [Ignavibacteriales bacterium]|nr:MAG: hypothetical protein F9K26_12065 [Ignavibacteriaceae bacterium]MBW7873236.1 hypothetical protein [Ignavibacteria bacterium]MCZ2142974.1 hypothetical protein [Ignavibacteriales bacterium]OQY73121.1 MAG: hypothetical protein B6D45_08400 [Ignavibacteriales bacterium UTCHB3]MBV6444661.1 hypothetical protein [Ignavibacteriaceae bacterium]
MLNNTISIDLDHYPTTSALYEEFSPSTQYWDSENEWINFKIRKETLKAVFKDLPFHNLLSDIENKVKDIISGTLKYLPYVDYSSIELSLVHKPTVGNIGMLFINRKQLSRTLPLKI